MLTYLSIEKVRLQNELILPTPENNYPDLYNPALKTTAQTLFARFNLRWKKWCMVGWGKGPLVGKVNEIKIWRRLPLDVGNKQIIWGSPLPPPPPPHHHNICGGTKQTEKQNNRQTLKLNRIGQEGEQINHLACLPQLWGPRPWNIFAGISWIKILDEIIDIENVFMLGGVYFDST